MSETAVKIPVKSYKQILADHGFAFIGICSWCESRGVRKEKFKNKSKKNIEVVVVPRTGKFYVKKFGSRIINDKTSNLAARLQKL